MRRTVFAASILVLVGGCAATAPRAAVLPPLEAGLPKHYVCPRATSAIVIDGRLDEPAWTSAPWTDDFRDIEGSHQPAPRYRTRAKLVWDDQHLYIGAELSEPDVWATLTKHDEIVFHDNDFEVFIDPDSDAREYYEVELNALNTVFDLLLVRTYRAGGPARHDWNLAGLQSAVHVAGTLNQPGDRDTAWFVEMALPWKALAEYAHRPAPPRPGDVWRANFSRVEWHHEVRDGHYQIMPGTREDNWVWSPQGVIDMHLPDRWGAVEFR